MSDKELLSILEKTEVNRGWGGNHIVKLLNTKMFVKTIPVTSLELKNGFDTKNIYDLPLYYNYGVGSAGLGAFRELALHIKTTNWVLAGETEGFPLMHHYRILKKNNKPKKMNKGQLISHNDYVKYWNNSKKVDRYIRERKQAEYEIVIFMEYIPFVLAQWLKPNLERIDEVMKKTIKIFDFLRGKGILHFDAHYRNILTDGEEFFLIDFGLGIDKKFNLSQEEVSFFNKHKNYDYMEFIGCSSVVLESKWHDLSSRKKRILTENYGIVNDTSYYEKINILLENIDEVEDIMNLGQIYLKHLKKYKKLISLSNNFFYNMRQNKKTTYPMRKVNSALKDSDVI